MGVVVEEMGGEGERIVEERRERTRARFVSVIVRGGALRCVTMVILAGRDGLERLLWCLWRLLRWRVGSGQ